MLKIILAAAFLIGASTAAIAAPGGNLNGKGDPAVLSMSFCPSPGYNGVGFDNHSWAMFYPCH